MWYLVFKYQDLGSNVTQGNTTDYITWTLTWSSLLFYLLQDLNLLYWEGV